MKQYLKYLKPAQTSPIPGEKMHKNAAGGYVFAISDKERLERFLILGTDGGTYYVNEEKLTAENATFVIDLIKRDSKLVFDTIKEIADAGRAPKFNTILFVYALLLTFGNPTILQSAYRYLASLCYSPTQLFSLLTMLKPLRGWSRGLRDAVANWYLSRDTTRLAYQMIKYRSRSGYTHRDVLRLCHAKCEDSVKNMILKYAVRKTTIEDDLHPQIQAFETLRMLSDEAWKVENIINILGLIKLHRLTWEMIPTERLNNQAVLDALIDEMPPTAIMRNLNRFAYNGMTANNNDFVKRVCEKLVDLEKLKLNKIHPVNVVSSMLQYRSGRGEKGNKTWTANQAILDALHDTYNLTMKTIEPTGKRILVGVDVSGSMNCEVSGMNMTCMQLGLVLAHTMICSEPNAEVICFSTDIHEYPFGKRHSIDTILKTNLYGGGTDCAIPLGEAYKRDTNFDAVVILTDNETWAGKTHSKQIYDLLKKKSPNIKIIEIAMVANDASCFKGNDPNVLRICGFDASVITLLQQFIGR